MSDQVILAIVATLGAVLTGAAGKRLIDRYFAREHERARLSEAVTRDGIAAAGETRKLRAADNEQRAAMLAAMLEDRDRELREIREREIRLREDMSDIKAQMARLEERSAAQAKEIAALQADVARWNEDYDEMKRERDEYRTAKHESDNKLTAESLSRQMAEREVVALKQENEQLRGQIAALLTKEQRS